MKICLIADLHLFSSEIGGNWSEDSFTIFKEKILPKVSELKPDIIVFLGDTLDPLSGRSDPTWPRGDKLSRRFVEALMERNIKNAYILRGNHDYEEPLRNISMMGGPSFIDNDWLLIEDMGFYFFSSRYPNLQKAINDLKSIPDIKVKTKILLMHENVNMHGAENIPREILKEISKKFDMIFNGHEHVYRHPYENVWCLSSALPWRPWYGNSDIEIIWGNSEEPKIKENENKFGFWIVETIKKDLNFIPVDIGVKIVTAELQFLKAPAATVKDKLEKLADIIFNRLKIIPENTIVRVSLEGTLKEGDERIDVGFSDIEKKYYSNFYEGKSKNILRLENLRGGGAYLSRENLRYISVEDALKQLETEIPRIRAFYGEIFDLIEKKTFEGELLIERIKNSKVLEAANDL